MPTLDKELELFLEDLPEGFSYGVRERLALRQLLLGLLEAGEFPQDPAALKTFLAPLICSTREQQDQFYRLFAKKWSDRTPPPSTPLPVDPKQSGSSVRRLLSRQLRFALAAAVACGLALIGVAIVEYVRMPEEPLTLHPPSPSLPPCCDYQPHRLVVTGRVSTGNGSAIPGAEVWIPGQHHLTAPDGAFKFDYTGILGQVPFLAAQASYRSAAGFIRTISDSAAVETWKARTSGVASPLTSLFGTGDGKRLWVAGDKGIILESEDGTHWVAQRSGTTSFLTSLFGTSDGKRLWAVGDNGTILESDDGTRWVAQRSGTTNFLASIFGTSNGKRLWAVGDNGTILESDDGGGWIARESGTTNFLISVFAASDGKRLWAVGDKGTILESNDGTKWTARTSDTKSRLNSVLGSSDSNRLWAIGDGGTILESVDGEHWNAQDSGTVEDLYRGFITSESQRLTIVGHRGTILKSDDGQVWTKQTSGTTNDLASVFGKNDGNRLWAVGDKGTIVEYDYTGQNQPAGTTDKGDQIILSPLKEPALPPVGSLHLVAPAGSIWVRDPIGATFSRGGTYAAIASRDSTVHIYDLPSWKEDLQIGAAASVLALSPDGNHLAISGSGESRVFLGPSKAKQTATELPTGAVAAMTFLPDGRTLVTSGTDAVLRVFDADSGQLESSVASTDPIHALSFGSADSSVFFGIGQAWVWQFTWNSSAKTLNQRQLFRVEPAIPIAGLQFDSAPGYLAIHLRGAPLDVWDTHGQRLKSSREWPANVVGFGFLASGAGDLGSGDLKDSGAAVHRLKDADPKVRAAALSALGSMQAKEQAGEVANLLHDRNSDVRAAAARAIGVMQVKDQAGAVAKLLKDPIDDVRIAAAAALVAMQVKDKAAELELTKLLRDPMPFMRVITVRELGAVQARDLMGEVTKLLKDPDSQVRASAAAALGAMHATQLAGEVAKLLKDQDRDVRVSAADALGAMQAKEQAGELAKLLRDPDSQVRIAAAYALGAIKAKDHAGELAKLLEDSDSGVRLSAAAALETIKGQNPTVGTLMSKPHTPGSGARQLGSLRIVAADHSLADSLSKLRWVAAVVPTTVIAAWLWWVLWKRSRLNRLSLPRKMATHAMTPPKAEMPFRGSEARRLGREMRQRKRALSHDLAVVATVRATAKSAGFFTPIFAERTRQREFLILINRAGSGDQQQRFYQSLAEALGERGHGAFIDLYTFHSLPATIRDHTSSGWTDLHQLAARHPDHDLWIIGDPAEFVEPFTLTLPDWLRELSRWQDHVLLTPLDVDERMLTLFEAEKITVAPASLDGMRAVLARSDTEAEGLPQHQRHFPKQLRQFPLRWVDGSSAGEGPVGDVMNALPKFLGPHGILLAAACSVYPETFWALTLWLAEKLIPADQQGRTDEREEALLRVTTLPWFRFGRIPDWMRAHLVNSLNDSDGLQVRQLIEEFLTNAKRGEGELTIARGERGDEAPLRDYVMFSFLLGRKVDPKLAPKPPSIWLRMLFEGGRYVFGPRLWVHVAAAIMLGICAWFASDFALSMVPTRLILTEWLLPQAAQVPDNTPPRTFPAGPMRRAIVEVADSRVGQTAPNATAWEANVVAQASSFVDSRAATRKAVEVQLPAAGLAFNGGFIESISSTKAVTIELKSGRIQRIERSTPAGPFRDYSVLKPDVLVSSSSLAGKGTLTATDGKRPSEVTGALGPAIIQKAAILSIVAGQGQMLASNTSTGKGFGSPLIVQVTDVDGKPLNGVQVVFTINRGSGSLFDGIKAATGVTVNSDVQGQASAGFTTNVVPPGLGFTQTSITAEADGTNSVTFFESTYSSEFSPPLLRFLNPQPGTVLTGQVGSVIKNAFSAIVVSSTGLPIPNVGVRACVPIPSDGNGVSSPCTMPTATVPFGTCVDGNGRGVLSDARGRVACDLLLSGVVGTGTIGFEVGHKVDTVAFPLKIVPGPPGAITIIQGNNQTGKRGQQLPLPLLARITDPFGNVAADTPITWRVLSSGVPATLQRSSSATDPNGQASTLVTLGNTGGVAVIQLSAGNASQSFALTVMNPPAAIQVVSGNDQSTAVSTNFTAPLVVQVVDDDGNPISGAPVTFTISSGSATIGTATVTTNSSGQASTTVIAGKSSGNIVIRATTAHFSVTFRLSSHLP